MAMTIRRFIDRVVLVTGASGGLGRAAAARFGAEGARLALLDRDGARVAVLAGELEARGYPALALAADVADETALATAFARAEAHFGRLDVVFNNAGVGGMDLRVAEIPVERWDEMLAINLRGVFLGCKHGIPALIRGWLVSSGQLSAERADGWPTCASSVQTDGEACGSLSASRGTCYRCCPKPGASRCRSCCS
jgi:NAD(P)-dependent dehydrogenase (short-subunit alcohol dehydrogenase family)